MLRKTFNALMILALLVGLVSLGQAKAMPIENPLDGQATGGDILVNAKDMPKVKPIDQPNLKDYQRFTQRRELVEAGKTAEADALAQTGTDKVLVLLVDFVGTDVFTWTQGSSHWDPLGIADQNEWAAGGLGDCSNIITETKVFTYTGPSFNQITVPAKGGKDGRIWTQDFSPAWYDDFMFKSGVVISYTAQDDQPVFADFSGKSVTNYYKDMSAGTYTVTGDVIGYLPINHSVMWYGADQCPGARSYPDGQTRPSYAGNIPGAGNNRTLVTDAIDAVNAKIKAGELPNFRWSDYDNGNDGTIDRLWIVHSGLGEEDSPAWLNAVAPYGEGNMWSHSSAIPTYTVTQVITVSPGVTTTEDFTIGPYIMMPENGGIGVFAHEYAHNLGAADLYAYQGGETSAGFWTLMADDWTGYPIGFEPPAVDAFHLDWWGWLQPKVIDDPSQVYEFKLGQASNFPGGENTYRGGKIVLPDQEFPLTIPPWSGTHYWYGGNKDEANGMMTLNTAIPIPASATTATLSFDLDYYTEEEWDFMFVEGSVDGGTTWQVMTNTNTICTHNPAWIGEQNGLPGDMCGAGIGGFSGQGATWPVPAVQTFDLKRFAGENLLLRFWYMTDWGTVYDGVFVDNVKVDIDGANVFTDDAEAGDANWTYQSPWINSNGNVGVSHNMYLQWRNTHENGGYDRSLGDLRWRYGPANTGLVVWYNNNFYGDNESTGHLTDYPSWGPKGLALAVDSHPYPARDPYWEEYGYKNEGANLSSRGQMRDLPFTLKPTNPFDVYPTAAFTDTHYDSLPAVPVFHDSLGYYPGAEKVNRGPAYAPTDSKWVTYQWDSSVVMPSIKSYGVNAPGYIGTGAAQEEWRFRCSKITTGANAGRLSCYWYGAATGIGYDGTGGNPADVDGQYGWHVQLLEEAADSSWAKVRVWNSMQSVDSHLKADKTTVEIGEVVSYTYTIENTGSKLNTVMSCVNLDSYKVEYVAGSAPDALLLPACPTQDAALPKLAPGAKVGALAWIDTGLDVREQVAHQFQVKAINGNGLVDGTPVVFADGKLIYTPVVEAAKVMLAQIQSFLPLIGKAK